MNHELEERPVSISSPADSSLGRVPQELGESEDITARQEAQDELQLLYEAGQQISQTLDLEVIYRTLEGIVSGVMDCDSLVVSAYDAETRLIHCRFASHQGQEWEASTFPPLPLNPEGQGTQSKVICTGEALLVGDLQKQAQTSRVSYYVTEDGEFVDHSTVSPDEEIIRSGLIVPVRLAGQVVGVIQVMSYRLNAYTPAHLRILKALASQIAVASNNALLYRQAQEEIARRQEAEEENARLYRDLERRMAELQETHDQLIQSARLAAVGELAAGVAHELNNPLTSIIGFAQLVLGDTPAEDPKYQDLETIVSEADRARTIVRNLLAFARQTQAQPQDSDLNALVQETLNLVRRHIKSDGLELVEAYAPDLPLLYVAPSRLKQVFLNLINNARQAMQRGDRLTLSSERVGDEIVVHVADTGRGIPAEDLDRIFNPFFTTKPVGQGTGLGLSISLGIVRDHGGRIEVESREGEGSTFSVWLPVAREVKDAECRPP